MEKEEIKLDRRIYIENEIDANRSLAKGCAVTGFILIAVWIMYLTKVFNIADKALTVINIFFPILIVILLSAILLVRTKLVEKRFFKYMLIIQYILVIFVLNILIPKHVVIMWAICIIIVNHYYNPKILIFSSILVAVLMLPAIYLAMLFGEWDANLLNGSRILEYTVDGVTKTIDCEKTTLQDRLDWLAYLKSEGDNRWLKAFLYYYIGRMLSILIVTYVCFSLSKRSYKLLTLEADSARTKAKINSELQLASGIQKACLPKPFDKKSNEDVYGLMCAAKQVGGDFYDYFYIDDAHLALVIGDVSGKGIPASLIMMLTDAMIKTLTETFKRDTNLIIKYCNTSFAKSNEANMFVTCWLGIINLISGELTYTNAGHNPPLVIQNGEVKFLDGKPGLVLGALPESQYEEHTIKLEKGDKILLYTDGVTEAHNSNNELYGNKRLVDFVKKSKGFTVKDLVLGLKDDVDLFQNGNEQFDDITLLAFEYLEEAVIMESRIFEADVKELNNLFDYSSSLLRVLNFSNKDIIMINTALEEVFVNVAKYAYNGTGTVEVSLSNDKKSVTFVFKDNGVRFNPLEREDPNITASSDEREIGGLGIFMVKKIMDEVKYDYIDNQNVLTLVKFRK
ncbi:MAG: SpoIIE family protein phosphatase [Acholeplasmatales bacterium]|nr:SpoIIE family protein phosphatase [Acholeplasmatales bacterium]